MYKPAHNFYIFKTVLSVWPTSFIDKYEKTILPLHFPCNFVVNFFWLKIPFCLILILPHIIFLILCQSSLSFYFRFVSCKHHLLDFEFWIKFKILLLNNGVQWLCICSDYCCIFLKKKIFKGYSALYRAEQQKDWYSF